MCGMCNCCPVIVPNDSCGAKACCYKSCPLSPDPPVFEIQGKFCFMKLVCRLTIPFLQHPRPPQPIPPLRHPRCFSCTWLIQAALFMSHKWCHCVIFFFFFFQRLLTRSIPSAPPDAWEQVKIIRQCFHSISNENLREHSVSNCVSDCSVWLGCFRYRNMPQEFRSHHHKKFRTFNFSIAF